MTPSSQEMESPEIPGRFKHLFPEATGEFTSLLLDLVVAFKIISKEVNKAGLAEVLGVAGRHNVHGEAMQKLEVFADETIFKAMDHGGHLCLMASEENEGILSIPDKFRKGKYVLIFDPVDGSSNIDVNVSIGTIFRFSAERARARTGPCRTVSRKVWNRLPRVIAFTARAPCWSTRRARE